jgi:acyl-CoA reductase-like NAD-dependent aldehyde dehydrogenase
MRHSKTARLKSDIDQTVQGLPRFSASSLATRSAQITREVMKRGASVITKHDEPTMVLMSMERYLQLERAAGQNLDLLAQQFDQLYSEMQKPGIARKTINALDL